MLKRVQLSCLFRRWLSSVAREPVGMIFEDTSQQYSLKEKDITATKSSNPTLANTSSDIWYKVHNLFSEYGFKTKNFLQIINEHPSVLTRSPSKVHESLELWRGCQFGESRVENLILRYPQLLDVLNSRKIQIQINTLQSYVSTPKNVWILLMNSPNLLQESPQMIDEKFNYLINIMRLEVPEIVKSEVFSFSLKEIKTRHIFLERLGIFKPRSLKAKPGDISKNPRLHRIMDRSEIQFATKTALVSLAEYEAFKQLYKREIEQNKKKDKDDHDDSDDE